MEADVRKRRVCKFALGTWQQHLHAGGRPETPTIQHLCMGQDGITYFPAHIIGLDAKHILVYDFADLSACITEVVSVSKS